MADIQAQIVEFDKKIRLSWDSEEKILAAKRDIILDKLYARFDMMRAEGRRVPRFTHFNQGSYEMSTGIRPVDGDYDIDVGLRFNCTRADYPNPVDLKRLVAEALEDHTVRGTDVHKSCVRVKYQLQGEQVYHVDLAIYVQEGGETGQLFLAKGEHGSGEEYRWWEESAPRQLTEWVKNRFHDAEREQFLRVIRALKRWKAVKFKTAGQNAPSGIGLTVAAGQWLPGQWLRPQVQVDRLASSTGSDDLKALRLLVETMVDQFYYTRTDDEGSALYRLAVPLPVAPGVDIFERMSDGQMTTFRDRLIQLRDRLAEVVRELHTGPACERMREDFGDDFPVPDKKDSAQRGGRAIVSSGVSA
jgi:hypothetical protein